MKVNEDVISPHIESEIRSALFFAMNIYAFILPCRL